MRKYWFATIIAAALLGGCDSGGGNGGNGANNAAGGKAAPAIAPGTSISGTVTFRDQIPIAQGSKLDVRLVDVAQPEIAIAEKTVEVGGTPPFNFAIDFDPSKIAATRTYEVKTILTDGPRRFVPALSSPVLTHGSTTTVQVVLNAEATPAELLKQEYAKLQAHIGGMKKVDGTYTTETASIGWDAFDETGNVRFVSVNTVADSGGRSSVKYAFTKEGKLMFAEESNAKVGWDDKDAVLVNEKSGGGTVADADIKNLHDAAAKAYQMAQEKVDAGKKK